MLCMEGQRLGFNSSYLCGFTIPWDSFLACKVKGCHLVLVYSKYIVLWLYHYMLTIVLCKIKKNQVLLYLAVELFNISFKDKANGRILKTEPVNYLLYLYVSV